MVGTCCESVDREATCVTEEVEHVASLGKAAHQSAVVTLVKEEACLLALCPVHEELATVLKDHLLVVRESLATVQISVDKFKSSLVWSRSRTLVVHCLKFRTVYLLQRLADLLLGAEHTHRVSLHHTYAVVVVDDEAREVVAFAVDQTVAVSWGDCQMKSGSDTHLKGACKHRLPEIRAKRAFVKAEHAHGDGTDLIMAIRQQAAVAGMHRNKISLSRIALNLCNCS